MENHCIQITGANTHNLAHLSLAIPRDQLVVITGRSGSGKSSLAIDTLFAEGQRQYLESLSLYSRQFFKQLPSAEVDSITGLPPTVCLDQKHGISHARSTVGTMTEIDGYLRLLMARAGTIHCYACGRPIHQRTPTQIRDQILALPERTKVMILAPVADRGTPSATIRAIRKEGLVRVRIDGQIQDIEQAALCDDSVPATIDAITDRIIVRPGIASRLLEALEFAQRLGDGNVIVMHLPLDAPSAAWEEEAFCTQYACPDCQITYAEIAPRTFSFNSPHGACPGCDGIGQHTDFDPDRVIPDRTQSIASSAVKPWQRLTPSVRKKQIRRLTPILEQIGLSIDQPLTPLTDEQWHTFLHHREKKRPGLFALLAGELATTLDDDRYDELLDYQTTVTCPDCQGARLAKPGLSVFLGNQNIAQIAHLPIDQAISFFQQIELTPDIQPIAEPIIEEILHRLEFLVQVGVGYLSLDRNGNTLSGGEHQRVRLAKSIGTGLTNVCYVLDEPTVGLHPRDNAKLLDAIRALQRSGNSVLLVEHDAEAMQIADHIVDMGPGAGEAGGRVIAQGTLDQIIATPESLTGDYLSGRRRIDPPTTRRPVLPEKQIVLTGASGRNLKSLDVAFPLGVFVCVTGVSGSGKSSLVSQTLVPIILQHLGFMSRPPLPVKSVQGLELIDQLVEIDQSPLGRSSRGCPATSLGIFDSIRKIFSATPRAKQLGFGISRFSFNTSAGWCPECKGLGVRKIAMNIMPDLVVPCDVCEGRRYNLQSLQATFNQMTIADVLGMSAEKGRRFFDGFETIARPLQCLIDVGLGYLPLGQSTLTLSGGESQRLKIACELARKTTGHTLYVLDEPTTGLHFEDVRVLLSALNRLVDSGNSLIVIEHHLDVIRCCDWVIDLGPEGGEGGGQLVAAGPPEAIAQTAQSHTGQFLAR